MRSGFVILIALTVLMPVILSLPFTEEPLARDQGYFAFGGWRILEGDLPYQDYWANTFPGVFWYYALLDFLSGNSTVPIALGNGILIGLTAFLLVITFPGAQGIAAGLIYGIAMSLFHRYWDIGQAEQLVNFFMILSFLTSRRSMYSLSGMAFSIAVLCKPISLLFLPVVVSRRIRWWVGAAIPLLLFLIPYIANRTLSCVYNDLIRFNFVYGGSRWDSLWIMRFIRTAKGWLIARYPLAVLAILAPIADRVSTKRVYSWLILTIAFVGIQAKFFSYHWIPALLPLSILAGFGFIGFLKLGAPGKSAVILVILLPLMCIPHGVSKAWYPAYHEIRIGVGYLLGNMDYESYIGNFGNRSAGSDFVAGDQYRLVTALKSLPQGDLLVWGFEPGIYYMSRRTCNTRFVVDFPLTFGEDDSRSHALRSTYRSSFLRDVRSDPPTYIVVVSDDDNPVEPVDSATQLQMFEEFRLLVHTSYKVVRTIENYRILRRIRDDG